MVKMVKVYLVALASGERMEFDEVEDLIHYLKEEVCVGEESNEKLEGILNFRDFDYGLEWVVE